MSRSAGSHPAPSPPCPDPPAPGHSAAGATCFFRAVWILYATALFVATHWPALQLPKPRGLSRLDLIIHAGAFFTWTILLWASALLGPRLARFIPLRVFVVAFCYAAFDESLQAIPILKRTCAWDDFAADLLGVFFAALLALALVSLARRRLGKGVQRASAGTPA